MRKAFAVKHSVKIRLYPNKTQEKWIELNLHNTTDLHNYFLSNIYEEDTEIDGETGEEREVIRINWDIINSKNGLLNLQYLFKYGSNLPTDRTLFDRYNREITPYYRDSTISNIYDQVCNDVKRNFCTFYRDGKGKPRFKSNRSRRTFRIPTRGRSIYITRRSDEDNHNNPYSHDYIHYQTSGVKTSSKLRKNIGWLHIPMLRNSFPNIRCFCPCNISSNDITSVTIIQEADGKYYATLVLKTGEAFINEPIALDSMLCVKETGIDINLSPKTRVVTSTSTYDTALNKFKQVEEILPASTPYKNYFSKLQKEQRSLSRKAKFSKNWFKQKLKVARIHSKIANIRLNFNRQIAAYLTSNYQSIAVEDLKVTQMKKGQPRWFQKLYNDANIYQLIQCIRWSCLKKGRELNYVAPEHTSKTCHNCWHTNHDLKLGQSSWICPNCGTIHHRDKNAAKNIYSLAWKHGEVKGELLENIVTYDSFDEREPITSEYWCKIMSKELGEEIISITA